jgi:hypothetical protein
LERKEEEREEEEREREKKKIRFQQFLNWYWPYPGWNTFRVDVFRINGLLNKEVLLV